MKSTKKWLLSFIALLFITTHTCTASEITVASRPLTVSVIIPCSYKHAAHLPTLLRSLEEQTVIPEEVVISLSEAHNVDPQIIDAIQKSTWAFSCILLTSPDMQYAGKNRNRACQQASGDIFILQDADDIPHPQRIEVIKYCFEHHNADHLMHEFVMISPQSPITFAAIPDVQKLKLEWNHNYESVRKQAKYHNGNIAIRRKVFDTVQWSETMARSQDTDFNRRTYKAFEHTAQLKAPLLYYRMFLSAAAK